MKKDEKIEAVSKAGFDPKEAQDWYRRYYGHRSNAVSRGLQSHLSFDQYLVKLKEAGITQLNQLGSYAGQFHLGRVGDQGDYVDDNCRFITSNQNHRESFANGGQTARIERIRGETKETSERAKKLSEAHLGRTAQTHEYIAARAEAQRGRTKETHQYLADKGPKISASKARRFELVAPDGTIHRGANITTFANEHNLSFSGLAGVCRGSLLQHKGWTGKYIDD